ncbi:MAG: hypothetical protein M3R24_21325 [Chloroflexota bacterium]|nr:hypothetical protein [Chloroflexota bacterium]
MGINIELRNWRRWTTAALLGLTALTGVVPAEAALRLCAAGIRRGLAGQ